jgi:hypothetical protein
MLRFRRRCEMAKKLMYVCLGILALSAAFHLGARCGSASTQTPEIAVDTGLIYHGETVPLPFYADGTQAQEDECTWVVIPTVLRPNHGTTEGFTCYAHGEPYRTVFYKQWTVDGQFFDSDARYLIIAVRGSGPTPIQPTTWGQIKAEFGENR